MRPPPHRYSALFQHGQPAPFWGEWGPSGESRQGVGLGQTGGDEPVESPGMEAEPASGALRHAGPGDQAAA